MSRFNKYVNKLNELSTAVFAEVKRAEDARAKAERKYSATKPGTLEYQRAKVELEEANEAYKKMRRDIPYKTEQELAQIRTAFAAEAEDLYAADPTQLDMQTIELLKSGILRPLEYRRLLNSAISSGNATMCRMIGKYASEAAEKCDDMMKARELRAVAYNAPVRSSDVVSLFDSVADVMTRCVANSAMIPKYGELTAPIIDKLLEI